MSQTFFFLSSFSNLLVIVIETEILFWSSIASSWMLTFFFIVTDNHYRWLNFVLATDNTMYVRYFFLRLPIAIIGNGIFLITNNHYPWNTFMVMELCAFTNVDLQNYSQSNFTNHGTNYLACLKYPSHWNSTSLPCPALSVLYEPVVVVRSKNESQPASFVCQRMIRRRRIAKKIVDCIAKRTHTAHGSSHSPSAVIYY